MSCTRRKRASDPATARWPRPDRLERGWRRAAILSGSYADWIFKLRRYEDRDRAACRSLWAELTEHHRDLYDDPSIGGDDPGAHFEQYVLDPRLDPLMVAEADGEIVGMTGLLVDGVEGEVEPVVVRRTHRRQGIGKAMLDAMVEAARERGLKYLNVRPVARNESALRMFRGQGFRGLGRIELVLPLTDEPRPIWREGGVLDGLEFRL